MPIFVLKIIFNLAIHFLQKIQNIQNGQKLKYILDSFLK